MSTQPYKIMKTFHSYNFLWLSITLFPLLIIAALLPVQPHDYWWYLRLGREILESGAVPVVDTYSSIQAGKPLVYQSWLSAVLFWLVYRAGEISWTVLFVVILIGITYGLLWILIRQSGIGPRLTSLLILLVGLSSSNNWGVRPQLLVYPIFIIALWILLRWQKQSRKIPWLLVLLGFLWANLHGSFILLFVLIGIRNFFGDGKKNLFVTTLVTLVVTLINPHGFFLWHSVLETFTSPVSNNFVTEWAPPINRGWQMNIFFAWLILIVPIASFARRRPTLFELILFLLFSWLAFTATRFVIWDLFIIAIFTANLMPESIKEWFDPPLQVETPTINFGLGAIFLLIPLLFLPGIRENFMNEIPLSVDSQTPISATEWMVEHPELSGLMWNDVVFGSYLIYKLPARPVWMDTRFQIIYTSEQTEQYVFVQSAQPGWDDFLKEKDVNLLFLAHTQFTLVKAVRNSGEWCEEYSDKVAVIFSRCELTP